MASAITPGIPFAHVPYHSYSERMWMCPEAIGLVLAEYLPPSGGAEARSLSSDTPKGPTTLAEAPVTNRLVSCAQLPTFIRR